MEATAEQQARWEQYLADKKAASERAAREMKQLSNEIAKHLGGGWQFREPEEDDNYWYEINYLPKCTSMESGIEAKCSIDIQYNSSSRGREKLYHISAGSVRTKAGYRENFGQFSINVSREKTAEQIARDIKRRMLPGYLLAFDAAVEKAKQRNQADNDQWETTKELASLIDYRFRERELENREAQLRWHAEGQRGYGDVRINSADSIDIKLSCNREMARRVLKLIGTREN